jgi:TolA-binding protein
MTSFAALRRARFHRPLALALAMAVAAPGIAQTAASSGDVSAETRIRKLEAEVRALQRQVFPGGDGKYFPPLASPAAAGTAPTGTPATTPVADLLVRVDAIEGQLARLTAQQEENGNKLAQLEARLAALAPAPATATPAITTPAVTPVSANQAATAASNGATTQGNLAAMTGGTSAPRPAPVSAAVTPRPAAATPKPAATTPASASRLAAVRAVEKPATSDAGDDEYSYGFRLWEAKFYPEAQQQLKLFLEKYPRHARRSYARNLLGRAYLDDGKPAEAQKWFLENYKDQQFRDRAPDSVLFLAEATKRQKDTTRACIALAQFADEFTAEASGRLKSQYDATRAGLKCS